MIAFYIIMSIITGIGCVVIEGVVNNGERIVWRFVLSMWALSMGVTVCISAMATMQGL